MLLTILCSCTNKNNADDYANAYYNVVINLIDQYGFYDEDEEYEWQSNMGFIRGDLIDFESDGIPELVCIYRKEYFHNICIYRYQDNQAILLVDELTGDSILGDNWSDIRFTDIDGITYILTQKCDWGRTEYINIYTVNKGVLETLKFHADAQVIENRGPHVEHYLNCLINEVTVSENEYRTQKEFYYKDFAYWMIDYEQDDAIQFIKSLATEAGISDNEIDNLIN